jgi:Family of unknown function (DUF6134)
LITRRVLLATTGAATLGLRRAYADLPVPRGDRLAFRVFRGDSEIGTHVPTFRRGPDSLEVGIAVDMRVGLGPITLFHYALRSFERWRGGQVEHLDVTTDDDGTHAFVRATRDSLGLWVEGSKASRYLAPPNALPSTHRNEAELRGPWINPENVELLRPAVARKEEDKIAALDGQHKEARHFALSGDVTMDIWYDATPTWVGLQAPARGSVIRYERL